MAEPALLRLLQAKQAQHIHRQKIAMKIHFLGSLIAARHGIAKEPALIHYMAQQMPPRIL